MGISPGLFLILGDHNMMRCNVAPILSGIPDGYVVSTVTRQCLVLSGALPLCISSRLPQERALILPIRSIGTTRICATGFGRILSHKLFDEVGPLWIC